jgi:hypothetical protein
MHRSGCSGSGFRSHCTANPIQPDKKVQLCLYHEPNILYTECDQVINVVQLASNNLGLLGGQLPMGGNDGDFYKHSAHEN